MKKFILFVVFTILSVTVNTVKAQDVAGIENGPMITEDKLYSSDNREMSESELKDLLISELKSTSKWNYDESQDSRIKIIILKNNYGYNPSDILMFKWTYEAPSKKRKGYNYVLKHRFMKNLKTNKIDPVIKLSPYKDYIKK